MPSLVPVVSPVMVMTLSANEIALGERVPKPAFPTLSYRTQLDKAAGDVKSVEYVGAAHPYFSAAVNGVAVAGVVGVGAGTGCALGIGVGTDLEAYVTPIRRTEVFDDARDAAIRLGSSAEVVGVVAAATTAADVVPAATGAERLYVASAGPVEVTELPLWARS